MLILGITGSLFAELWHKVPPRIPYRSDFEGNHDAAAVLLDNGRIVAAIEQERVDRIKHSGGFPVDAIQACLKIHGCSAKDVELVACSYSHTGLRNSLLRCNLNQRSQRGDTIEMDPGIFIADALTDALGSKIAPTKVCFVKHHLAHAASAFWPSGFDRALVGTIDGAGEDESGSFCIGDGGTIQVLRPLRHSQSLGLFYLSVIRLLGFRMFDEYKVMGLAPYGNPSVYESAVADFYELKPEGEYVLHLDRIPSLAPSIPKPEQSSSFSQQHMDLAASLQGALERIVFHAFSFMQRHSGLRNLCLAGGVAHNCTLNGKLRASGLFDRVFVQPAAHDGGLALGAALMVHQQQTGSSPAPLSHVYLGRGIGSDEEIESTCRPWSDFLTFYTSADALRETAALLDNKQIIGWVQGRSEYGPRALGNRSILADPRPAENKNIINAMIKKREGFRPFAPAVAIEHASEYFEVPRGDDFAYMTFVVDVRPEKRATLGAVCHVDGTARLQTVSRTSNPKFWSLIHEFSKISGIPVLLNTSFNNNAEPIVDSVIDSIICFLTTGLHALVIGNVIVRRKSTSEVSYLNLVPQLRTHTSLNDSFHRTRDGRTERSMEIRPLRSTAGNVAVGFPVSELAFDILKLADGKRTLAQLAESRLDLIETAKLVSEMTDLWSRRLIDMAPA